MVFWDWLAPMLAFLSRLSLLPIRLSLKITEIKGDSNFILAGAVFADNGGIFPHNFGYQATADYDYQQRNHIDGAVDLLAF